MFSSPGLASDGMRRTLDRQGYAKIPSFLSPDEAKLSYEYAVLKARTGRFAIPFGDTQVPGAPAEYADPLAEVLLLRGQQMLQTRGLSVLPTYSYCRIYQRGDRLERHSDRAACEISITCSIGGATDNPLHLEFKGEVSSVILPAGDGLAYRGDEVAHWREPLHGDHLMQMFLHYVWADGPNVGEIFDGRRGVGHLRPVP